jgi:polyhydroxybutyrate depolymerase
MDLRLPAAVVSLSLVLLAACDDGGGSSSQSDADAGTTEVAAEDIAPQPSPGCDATPAVALGEAEITTTSSGAERWYYRNVPKGYDGTEPTPVVFDFHGYLEGAVIHIIHSELRQLGDKEGFITITPHGKGPVPRWRTDLDSVDMTFIGDLLDEVNETLCVDQRRVYSTGLSNGAFLSSAMACVYSDRIAAVAPVAGIRDIEDCEPARPVPVVAFHGTADQFVLYEGGYGSSAINLPNPDGSPRTRKQIKRARERNLDEGPSIPEISADWAERNGCEPEPIEEQIERDVTFITFDCPPGAEVELYAVDGGGHSWPGSEFSVLIEPAVGHTTFSISANEVMWEFFEQHPLPE